jgi:hypothetical protein
MDDLLVLDEQLQDDERLIRDSVAGVPGQNKKPHITGILSAIEINKS